jgi:hypothetical protein
MKTNKAIIKDKAMFRNILLVIDDSIKDAIINTTENIYSKGEQKNIFAPSNLENGIKWNKVR